MNRQDPLGLYLARRRRRAAASAAKIAAALAAASVARLSCPASLIAYALFLAAASLASRRLLGLEGAEAVTAGLAASLAAYFIGVVAATQP